MSSEQVEIGRPKPCPAVVSAVLGLPRPTLLPCCQLVDHSGKHRYTIEWSETDWDYHASEAQA